MLLLPDVLWLNVSPALQRFDRPLLQVLSQSQIVAQWQYLQTLDEPNSLEAAVDLLHDYLQTRDRPIHLIGHGTSGLLGLLYARYAPHRVKSLTLLSVGAYPAVDWQAHYHTQAQLLPCSRDILLAQMVHTLWGWQSPPTRQALIKRLDRDLLTALSPHTLLRQASIPPEGAPVPLLVCAGGEDLVISPSLFDGWQPHLKPGDRHWLCPHGRYFFHQAHAEQTAQQIQAFWHSLPGCSVPSALSRTPV